jgi:S1-C subfamily serine protease
MGVKLTVAGVAPGAPADKAGVKAGDVVLEVAGAKPSSLVDLWRRAWALGSAGVEVPLKLQREGRALDARVASARPQRFPQKTLFALRVQHGRIDIVQARKRACGLCAALQ